LKHVQRLEDIYRSEQGQRKVAETMDLLTRINKNKRAARENAHFGRQLITSSRTDEDTVCQLHTRGEDRGNQDRPASIEVLNEKSNLPAVIPLEKMRSSLSMKMLNANRQIEENRILGENYKIATRIGNVQSSLSKELISEDLEKFKTIKSKQHEELKKDPSVSRR
jgi:hypothetical protein